MTDLENAILADELAAELAAEHGDVLPPSLVEATVATAATCPDPEEVARADVAALATAARRRPA